MLSIYPPKEQREAARQATDNQKTAEKNGKEKKRPSAAKEEPKAELALLGRLPDEEVARRTGRSVNAVRQKREVLARGRRANRK